jgi:hypothetical protein
MIETHKMHIDYAITIISASSFYISNTSVSTAFTSIVHINFNGEHLDAKSTGKNPDLPRGREITPCTTKNEPPH